jgi:hypothetical protein
MNKKVRSRSRRRYARAGFRKLEQALRLVAFVKNVAQCQTCLLNIQCLVLATIAFCLLELKRPDDGIFVFGTWFWVEVVVGEPLPVKPLVGSVFDVAYNTNTVDLETVQARLCFSIR